MHVGAAATQLPLSVVSCIVVVVRTGDGVGSAGAGEVGVERVVAKLQPGPGGVGGVVIAVRQIGRDVRQIVPVAVGVPVLAVEQVGVQAGAGAVVVYDFRQGRAVYEHG